MSLQNDILETIKSYCTDMNTNLVIHTPNANNVGYIGLRKRFEIIPVRWATFSFHSDYATFYMNNNDGSHMLTSIHYFKMSNEECMQKINIVVDYLKNGCA